MMKHGAKACMMHLLYIAELSVLNWVAQYRKPKGGTGAVFVRGKVGWIAKECVAGMKKIKSVHARYQTTRKVCEQ